ncbi:hypothetical protein [Aeoliella sp.]|uniref:hypothetical protein n=1 Tax=Aeoliella sp. TaxID=2795800 RepID=UPI003CCBAFD3
MGENASQAESGEVRPSPALLWTKKSTRTPKASEPNRGTPSVRQNKPKRESEALESSSLAAVSGALNKPKTSKNTTRTSSAKQFPFAPKHYVDLSTKARKSVQLAIAELRHTRKKAGKPHTIKHFIEEALTAWKDSPRARLGFVPEGNGRVSANDADPFETFNNVIELELKRELADICHERGKVGHPVRTMVLILDDAISQWLHKQGDLQKLYLEAVDWG